MKILLVFLLIFSSELMTSQIDSLEIERYEIINNLFGKKETSIESTFMPFLGLSAIIGNADFIDSLLGHCFNNNGLNTISYSEIISSSDIEKMRQQIGAFQSGDKLNDTFLSDKIKLSLDGKENFISITKPIISGNKAIVYQSNNSSSENLFVLIRKDDHWKITCRKSTYFKTQD